MSLLEKIEHLLLLEKIECSGKNLLAILTFLPGYVNSKWQLFKDVFFYTIKRFIPQKEVTCRSSLPPWLTKEVRRCLQKQDSARRQARKQNTSSAWEVYRQLRNTAIQAVRRSKEKFFSTMASKVTPPRDFWKEYHSITKVHAHLRNNMVLGDCSSSTTINLEGR